MDATSMLIGGQWRSAIGTGRIEDVTSPYDGSVVGTVPVAEGMRAGTVVAETEQGYTLDGLVLRPARVIVAGEA